MLKHKLLGVAAAGGLALSALVIASPATAGVSVYVGQSYGYYPAHYRHSCWHWSYRLGEWVNSCRIYSYRYVEPYYSEPYAYGYAPYYYGPSFGFSFSIGRHHHH